MYYILGIDCHLFRNISVWYPRKIWIITLSLGASIEPPWGSTQSTSSGARAPYLCMPTTPTREDRIFMAFRQAIPNTKAREARKNAWISADTWRIANTIVSMGRYSMRNQGIIRPLRSQMMSSLKVDRWRQLEASRGEIDSFLASYPHPPPHKES